MKIVASAIEQRFMMSDGPTVRCASCRHPARSDGSSRACAVCGRSLVGAPECPRDVFRASRADDAPVPYTDRYDDRSTDRAAVPTDNYGSDGSGGW